MFSHIFINRFKCLVRDRQLVFWTFLYPLVLATLFGLAFANLSGSANFAGIPIAVVDNAEYRGEKAFRDALASVSDENGSSSGKLFHITLATRSQAEDSLKNNGIKGYILFENGAHVVVKDSGIGQTILKEFMDSYLQTGSAYASIIQKNPDAARVIGYDGKKTYLKSAAPGKAAPNTTVVYFYALIAMASLFGGFWGKKEVDDIQADLTPQGARLNLAPVHKMKAFGYSLCAAVSIHFISLLLLVAYLCVALKVDFGGQLGFVLVTCFFGSTMGVSFGALIGALVKGNGHIKIAVMISVSMFLSFLAGLMNINIKYTVTHAAPALAYINPANLISDAFYSLYYYSSHTRLFINLGLLLGFSIVFYLVVYFVTRRQKYASL